MVLKSAFKASSCTSGDCPVLPEEVRCSVRTQAVYTYSVKAWKSSREPCRFLEESGVRHQNRQMRQRLELPLQHHLKIRQELEAMPTSKVSL